MLAQIDSTINWYESLNAIHVGAVIVELGSGRVVFANNMANQLTGGYPRNVQSEKVFASDPQTGQRLTTEELPRFRVARGEQLSGVEIIFHNQGYSCHMSVYSHSLPPVHDQPACAMMTFQDITHLKKAEEAAESANRLKTAFLANMSHEIRTPLGAILGFTDLLQNSSLTAAERADYLKIIDRSGKALVGVIDDVLDLSKMEAGRLEFELVPVAFRDLLNNVMHLFRDKAKTKMISLELEDCSQVPAVILSDTTRLRQILINVIGNAVKFTDHGGVIVHVQTLPIGVDTRARIRIAVEDSGPGLSQDQQTQLFQPFSQADSSTTRKFGGTGLGLILSRRLARALGGDVIVESSSRDVGSTFVITIEAEVLLNEVAKESSFEEVALPPLDTALALEKKRILLIEDSPDNQLLIRRYLLGSGAEIDDAPDGQEGVRKALIGNYDLILMDIQMPVLDGFRATQMLREMGYQKPIIALTAHAMKEEREKSLEVGCNDHLTKPIDSIVLIRTIANHCMCTRDIMMDEQGA